MKKKNISAKLAALAAMALVCCAMFSSALAQTLSYQGVLKTTAGNVTAGTRLLTVTLYGDQWHHNSLASNYEHTGRC